VTGPHVTEAVVGTLATTTWVMGEHPRHPREVTPFVFAVAERFFALLALLALGGAGVIAGLVATGRVPAWLRTTLALPLSTAVATTATLGSLYLSEIAGYPPCVLCWYQRIAMYPLVVVLGVAALRGDTQVWRTSVPLAGVGAAIAVYHLGVERLAALGGSCDISAPCDVLWVQEFGFVTIPGMALAGFLAIISLSLAARSRPTDD